MSPFLWTGTIFAFFHSFGKHSFITLLLKRICRGFEIDVVLNLNMRTEIPSLRRALFGSNGRISLTIVSVSTLMSESLATVSMVWLLGRELSFVISLHCSLKKSLNRSALSKKSVTNSLFARRGGINGIFEPLTIAFKIDQYVFGAVLGSLSLIASLSWYLALEKLIAFDNSSVISLKIAWSIVLDSLCFWNTVFSF